MYEMEQAAKAAATKYLQEEGVEDAEKVLRSVEELLQNAESVWSAISFLRLQLKCEIMKVVKFWVAQ